jgi:hypothetical protein
MLNNQRVSEANFEPTPPVLRRLEATRVGPWGTLDLCGPEAIPRYRR